MLPRREGSKGRLGFVVLGLSLALGACSSSSGSPAPACGTAACGGDLVGTWTARTACSPGTQSYPMTSCGAQQTETFTRLSISGTVTFAASGKMSGDLSVSASARDVVPQGCWTSAQCSQQQANTRSVPGVTATCTFNGACTCDVSDVEPYGLTGLTYQTSGSSIMVDNGNTTTTGSYCVKGNTLTLIGALPESVLPSVVYTR